MASNRKKVQQPIYNDPGWGDSFSVSKKARKEIEENSPPPEETTQEIVQEVPKKKDNKAFKSSTDKKNYSFGFTSAQLRKE